MPQPKLQRVEANESRVRPQQQDGAVAVPVLQGQDLVDEAERPFAQLAKERSGNPQDAEDLTQEVFIPRRVSTMQPRHAPTPHAIVRSTDTWTDG